MESVNTEQEEMVSLLLEQPEIEVNARNVYGETALHYAALHGKLAMVQKLLSACDIDPYIEDFNGQTATMNATKQGHEICVTLLLDKTIGAHQYSTNSTIKTLETPETNFPRFSADGHAAEQVYTSEKENIT